MRTILSLFRNASEANSNALADCRGNYLMHTPFFSNYRPQFFFRTSDITGSVNALRDSDDKGDVQMAMPGDNVVIAVELGQPVAMEPGLRFAIREGGRTIGSGTVTSIEE